MPAEPTNPPTSPTPPTPLTPRTGKGFPCSQCGGATKVIWSRFTAHVGTRRRRCRDRTCGHAETTYEGRNPPPPWAAAWSKSAVA